jgi:3-oxoacyl-[acyl-carrier-protein] synthase-3
MEAEIRAITATLPDRVVTNDELDREHPEWNLELVAHRMGVQQRHIAGPDETTLDLGHRAALDLFEAHGALPSCLDVLIFCTQSADYILPPNATVLHGRLDLPQRVSAFDINLACSGFVYALDIARSMIRAGSAENIVIVAGDTYSKYINPGDRSARVLFGDAATASWIAAADRGLRISDISCCTSGREHAIFMIPAGGCRQPRSDATRVEQTDESGNVRSAENIHMAGRELLHFMATVIPKHVTDFLAERGLTRDDIDLYVFHQASAVVIDSLRMALGLTPERVFVNLSRIGNTVSASIPMALRDAQAEGRIASGQRLLLCGFGVGLSWASALIDAL